MVVFDKLKEALKKTRELFKPIKENKNLDAIEEILLSADIGVGLTQHLIKQIKESNSQNFVFALRENLIKILSCPYQTTPELVKPTIIMIVGVPGSGKTTTIAKLANYFQKRDLRVLISASDTYRAAAAKQLGIWAERVNAEIVWSSPGQDPGAVTYDALSKAQAHNFDIVLIDTAGRLHTRKDLMEEAKKIKRVCQKFRANAPDEIWLVLDANFGQNGIAQARIFHQELNLTGLIVTKLDGTAKGGIIVPIVWELKLPVRFIGIGEGLDDLEEFDSHQYIAALIEQ
ncbi:MAG: signal recognition particle-docking protein FtsY [candidate division WOR-3 bacterium]|nr:signal recognition particle-docking protein FtsY [candidate division WOR-3 bacterium]MCX7757788.1 signal recognition particle-docking protein FtsY [candidate division WOR-3 bacterium]MDW7987502.1 signal recognition particle-docking protein FtsY [candidate division WOR-3 bacterium]